MLASAGARLDVHIGPTRIQTVPALCRSGRAVPSCLPALRSWQPGGVVILLCHFVSHSVRRLLILLLPHRLLPLLFSIQFPPSLPPSIIIPLLCMASACSVPYAPLSGRAACTFLPPSLLCLLISGKALDRPWLLKDNTGEMWMRRWCDVTVGMGTGAALREKEEMSV